MGTNVKINEEELYKKGVWINKGQFLRLVSKKSGFRVVDVKHMWKAFADVVYESLLNEATLEIRGFARFTVDEIKYSVDENGKLKKQWDGINKVWYELDPEHLPKRVNVMMSRRIRNALHEQFLEGYDEGLDGEETEEEDTEE